jgi:glycosyltransferase involved in cell wall biosynthesis
MKNPKVTVLMSVYNGEKYLNEAIDSILGQTFKDFEFLIINDGSTDKTAEILKSYNDPRIKIINNEKNIGLTKSLNKGLKLARGEYIARQDADDISCDNRLERQIKFLDKNLDIAIVGTNYFRINEKGDIIQKIKRQEKDKNIKKYLLSGNQLGHGTIMFRKSCFEKVGFYREEFKFAQDYDLVLRFSEKYKLANIPETLYKWRINSNSVSVSRKIIQDRYANLALKLFIERKKIGYDRLEKGEKIEEIFNNSFEVINKKEIFDGYFFWGMNFYDNKAYISALKNFLFIFFRFPIYPKLLFMIFKTLFCILFPKNLVEATRRFKKFLDL